MPTLIQYKIIDGFNEYNDYLIHKDDIDESDDDLHNKDIRDDFDCETEKASDVE